MAAKLHLKRDISLDQAEEILPVLDADAVRRAALRGNDMGAQTEYAQREIALQIEARGLLA